MATTNANVAFVRKEVRNSLTKWDLVRDCIAGQERIKSQRTKYLPMPNSEDKTPENTARYNAYLERALFYNATNRTLGGLVGQVFVREPVLELPDEELKPLEKDADGAGVSLNQQAKKTLQDTMSFGRVGLLTDYPPTEGPTTREQQKNGFIRPTILVYQPEQIINWRTTVVGARKLLSLVTLEEEYEISDDGFEPQIGKQWRVLRLIDGVYTVTIYRTPVVSPSTTNTPVGNAPAFEEHQTFVPLDSKGKQFTEIPFTIIGSVNNDPEIDPAPLYDLAVVNIAHYRNSADYEESCFLVGQPTLWMSGLTEYWVKNVLNDKVQMGSRTGVALPENSQAGLLQVNPNSMPKEAMESKERQMVALGARLVEQRNVQRTLGEAQLEESGETSILATVAKNISAAYTQALKWASSFVGGSDKVSCTLNTDFDAANMTSEARAELVAEWQAGAITYDEMRAQLHKAGVATEPNQVAQGKARKDKLRMESQKKAGNPGNSVNGGSNNGRAAPKQSGKTQK